MARANAARTIRTAATEAERALLWKGRKSAFGAIARIKPNYYLHDTVIPRTRLVEVLDKVYEIAQRYDLFVMNVFHAGDGNLHPLLVYDARVPGTTERVHAAGKEIVEASLAVGGVLSGEHGIGLEKRDFMRLQFSDDDLEHQAKLRRAFDPLGLANPAKVLPMGASCADVQSLSPAQLAATMATRCCATSPARSVSRVPSASRAAAPSGPSAVCPRPLPARCGRPPASASTTRPR